MKEIAKRHGVAPARVAELVWAVRPMGRVIMVQLEAVAPEHPESPPACEVEADLVWLDRLGEGGATPAEAWAVYRCIGVVSPWLAPNHDSMTERFGRFEMSERGDS